MSGRKKSEKPVDEKPSMQQIRKKTTMKPGQTKSSLHRQLLAQRKKLQAVSLVPDEVLYNIFEYLNHSDLLRCSCVSRLWNEVANLPALWEKIFKRLPKACRDFSKKAKTWGQVNWKKECIFCALERRKQKVKKLMRESSLPSAKKAKAEATRTLHIRWLLLCASTNNQQFEVEAEEDFIFVDGISIRWNNVDIPSLSKMKWVKFYALTPLFYERDWKPERNSVCTRSLIMTHEFKGGGSFTFMKPLHGDEHVDIFVLKKYLYFALWKSSLPTLGDVAFIGVTAPLHNLLQITQNGTSERIYEHPTHSPIIDDVDARYGLHSYKASITLRNSRKVYFHDVIKEFEEGVLVQNQLRFQHRRYDDYVFYDIKEQMNFLWKTAVIKSRIQDFVVLDVNLYDVNDKIMWSCSSPAKLTKVTDEQDNYSYEDCEIWKLGHQDEIAELSIEVIKNGATMESTILTLTFHLQKSFINKWFALNR